MTDVSTSLVEPDYGPRTTADYGLRPGCKIDAGCKSNLKTKKFQNQVVRRVDNAIYWINCNPVFYHPSDGDLSSA